MGSGLDGVPSVLMIMLCMNCGLGGAEKRYARVFEMLVADGGRHKLLINRSLLELLQSAGILCEHGEHLIVVDAVGVRLLDVVWYAWQCWLAIGRYRPDVVHPLLTGIYLGFPALMISRVPYVMSAYSNRFRPRYGEGGLAVAIATIIKRLAMRWCRVVDALTLSIQEDLMIRGVVDWSKVRVAPCSFTDVSLCRPARKEKWVVFCGRLVGHKNPLLLVEAMPGVIAAEPGVHFYILGRGELKARVEARCEQLGVAERVTIGFERRPIEILNRSSIFVSLQAEDNYPSQSLLEAMACGNAVVATDVGETWRLVDEGNGVRVAATADAVAEGIIHLLRDPLLVRRGLVSRQRVLKEHTAAGFLRHMVGVYDMEPDLKWQSER